MERSRSERRERIRDEAARWVVRLAEPHTAQDLAGFEAWRAEDIANDIAYARELAAWERLDRLKALRAPTPVARVDDAEPAGMRRWLGGPRRRWLAFAASLLLMAAAGALVFTALSGAPAYATGLGERRLVVLPDGSRIELNTETSIVVRFGRDRRLVELVRGEVQVHVSPNPRPFVVRSPTAEIQASAAEMTVRQLPGGTRVTVERGQATADAIAPTRAARVALGPNAGAEVDAGAARSFAVAPVEVARSLAWRRGAVSLDGQTLEEAVAEFNRYNARKIVIADARIAGLRVGGYFQTTDTRGFVDAVAKTFPVRAAAGADGEIRLSSSS